MQYKTSTSASKMNAPAQRLMSNARRAVGTYEAPEVVAAMPEQELLRQYSRFKAARLQAIHACNDPYFG